jgi:hypothetical protein
LPGKGKKQSFEGGRIEMYDQARFFTVTGKVFNDAPSEIEEHQSDSADLYNRISGSGNNGNHQSAHEAGNKIPKGQRHNTLLSLAGSMRNRGMSVAAIDAALQIENSTRCFPPYDAAHVRKIAEDAGKLKPGESASNFETFEWQEPIPLNRRPPDDIPVKCLPGWMGEMANAMASALEVPFELPALIGAAVVSSCVAGKAVVSPEPGYSEPLNLYTTPAMEPGNRKTAVCHHMP